MSYSIILKKQAEKDIKSIIKSGDSPSIEKLKQILNELEETPKEGTGKPERLKYQDSDIWSRRINKKDRLIYEIFEDEIMITVISSLGHYEDN